SRFERFPIVIPQGQPWGGAPVAVPYYDSPVRPVLALIEAVCWVLSFGLALQYYHLIYGKGGLIAFRLFCFLAWGLPMLLCILAGIAQSQLMARFLLALSPPSALVLTTLPDTAFWGGSLDISYMPGVGLTA